MRVFTVKALWAVADVLEIVRDGCIVAASKVLA
jgi:hypothetical protein